MDFADFARRQFPFQPQHPDWDRLKEVVAVVEKMKADRLPPEEGYKQFVDVYSASYLAVNRGGMTLAGQQLPDAYKDPEKLFQFIVEQMSNAWVEGLFFGIYFQLLGGHRNEDGTSPAQEIGH